MSLGKRKDGAGDIIPLMKFDARARVLYRCDRTRAPDGEWYTDQKTSPTAFRRSSTWRTSRSDGLPFPRVVHLIS